MPPPYVPGVTVVSGREPDPIVATIMLIDNSFLSVCEILIFPLPVASPVNLRLIDGFSVTVAYLLSIATFDADVILPVESTVICDTTFALP